MVKALGFLFLCLIFISCDKILYLDEVPPRGFETKSFKVQNFDRIEINNAFFVTIVKSNEFKVDVKGAGEDIDDLDIEVSNGKLEIRYDQRIRIKKPRRYKMEMVISTSEIKEIEVKSASDTEIRGFDEIANLKASISSASKLRINNSINKLFAEISGASTLVLAQKTKEIDVEIKSSSSLEAFEAFAEKAFLELKEASKAELSVSDLLEVSASGASRVTYKGDPKIVEDLKSGSKIKKE
jgi:hypothetical protein